jgi:hypothetical protein
MRQVCRAQSLCGLQRPPRARFGRRESLGCLLACLLLAAPALRGADRCSHARDDILQAQNLIQAGRKAEAQPILQSAFMACPSDPRNLELLAATYDSLQDFDKAALFRGQAFRLKGVFEKPTVKFTSSRSSFEHGQTATLNWSTQYATNVEITPDLGRVAARGSKLVGPLDNTTYQIKATGPGGTVTATVEISVTKARLTEDVVRELLKNNVPCERVAQLADQRGVSFDVTPEIERDLRQASANDALIEALRKARR